MYNQVEVWRQGGMEVYINWWRDILGYRHALRSRLQCQSLCATG